MKTANLNYKSRIYLPDNLHFVGSQRPKNLRRVPKLEETQGKNVQMIPYVLTGSGEQFIGMLHAQVGNSRLICNCIQIALR